MRKLNTRGADKFLARPGRKEANVSVRMERISFGALPCQKNKKIKIDDTSRLDVVESVENVNILPVPRKYWRIH